MTASNHVWFVFSSY